MRIAVVQLGARMHYAVPRIFATAGVLDHLYTDVVGNKGWPRLLSLIPDAVRPAALRKMLGRIPHGVPADRIVSFPSVGLRYALRLRRAAGRPNREADAHLAAGRELAARVIRRGFSGATAVYGFNSASLEVFTEAKRRGLATIYEQTIAPVRLETRLMAEEYARWPEWETAVTGEVRERFAEQESAEWPLADAIVCGSTFVRDGIVAQGGPAERCSVVPYGVDSARALGSPRHAPRDRPLRVLTVGAVNLRKGAPYVAAAAVELAGRAEFRWVGPCQLTDAGRARMLERVELTGAVPRTEVAAHFDWADVFLLPSVCEGSATVTYEALAAGLPILVTPNAGAPVPAGTAGAEIPVAIGAATAVLRRWLDDPALLATLSEEAVAASVGLTVAAYGERLLAAVRAGIPRQ